jgi:hypothetical protein
MLMTFCSEDVVAIITLALPLHPPPAPQVPEAERLGQELELDRRVEMLIEYTCFTVFSYIAQGLFERHKLIVATQVGGMITTVLLRC